MRKIRRPTPATVIALLALFVALGGSAVALRGKNTVRSDDIKNRQVKTKDVALDAVGGNQIQEGALRAEHIAPRAISGDLLAPNAVTGDKIAPGSIGSTEIADGAVGPEHINPATPTASVTHSADQTIPFGDLTKLNFDIEVSDTANLHSASPSSCLTPPTAGVYSITAGVTWAARDSGARVLFLLKNDTTRLGVTSTDAVTDGSETAQSVSAIAELAAGDCVTVGVLQTSTTLQGPPPPLPASLAVKGGAGSPSFTMAYAVPGS